MVKVSEGNQMSTDESRMKELRARRDIARTKVWPQPTGPDDGVNIDDQATGLSSNESEQMIRHIVRKSMKTTDK